MWKNGVKETIKVIEPSILLIYGGKLDFYFRNTEVVYFENDTLRRWKDESV